MNEIGKNSGLNGINYRAKNNAQFGGTSSKLTNSIFSQNSSNTLPTYVSTTKKLKEQALSQKKEAPVEQEEQPKESTLDKVFGGLSMATGLVKTIFG